MKQIIFITTLFYSFPVDKVRIPENNKIITDKLIQIANQ